MQPVLVIVDMQPRFSASKDNDTINAIRRLIRKFRKNEDPIVVLEYKSPYSYETADNKTNSRLLELLHGYLHTYFKIKNANNGGPEVLEVWEYYRQTRSLPSKEKPEFVVCGVNTTACVRETAEYLFNKKYAVTVIEKACNCEGKEFHDNQIAAWRKKRSRRFRVS